MVLQVEMNVNNSDIRFPNQLFINNEFIDASDGVTFDTINPADNSVRPFVLTLPQPDQPRRQLSESFT